MRNTELSEAHPLIWPCRSDSLEWVRRSQEDTRTGHGLQGCGSFPSTLSWVLQICLSPWLRLRSECISFTLTLWPSSLEQVHPACQLVPVCFARGCGSLAFPYGLLAHTCSVWVLGQVRSEMVCDGVGKSISSANSSENVCQSLSYRLADLMFLPGYQRFPRQLTIMRTEVWQDKSLTLYAREDTELVPYN